MRLNIRRLCAVCLSATSIFAPASAIAEQKTPRFTEAENSKAETKRAPTKPSLSEEQAVYKRLDAMTPPTWAAVFPPVADSILQDFGGWRSTLADYGISVAGRSTTGLAYDILGNNTPASPQAYNGQKFTIGPSAHNVNVTADLDRWFGLDDAKLTVGGMYMYTNFEPLGPTAARIRELTYYQSFLNRTLEIKFGYNANYWDFVGVFTGGNPILAAGVGSLIPVQTGLSVDLAPTPTFNVRINGADGTYLQGGIQRSSSPRGSVYDVKHNGIGLDFSSEGASALYIGEVGLKRPPTEGSPQIWLRAGAMYNTSDYTRFSDGEHSDNWSLFALGDIQVAQIDNSRPYRGVYVGLTAEYAPSDVNLYTQYYEARVYATGLLDSRPLDSVTLTAGYNRFSQDARDLSARQGLADTPADQVQISASYVAHLMHGVYLTPSISYIKHPAFGSYKDAFLVGLALYQNW